MIVLAFTGALSNEARQRIQYQFEEAKRLNRMIVVEDCDVLSDDAENQATIKFSDGSVAFIPDGLTQQAVIEAIREIDERQRTA
jgi:hypothetical protein